MICSVLTAFLLTKCDNFGLDVTLLASSIPQAKVRASPQAACSQCSLVPLEFSYLNPQTGWNPSLLSHMLIYFLIYSLYVIK